MRRVPWRFWALAAILVVLNAGGWLWLRRELTRLRDPELRPVRIVSALPANNVDAADRLSLLFDAPLATPEAAGQPVVEALFQIQPQPQGRWVWNGPQRLDFMLAEPLPAGREFKIKPAADIELKTGRVVQVDGEIEFKTRSLKLEACLVQSSDRTHVQLELRFNQPVNPGDLLRNVKVTDVDKAETDRPAEVDALDSAGSRSVHKTSLADLKPSALTQEPSERIVLRCRQPSSGQLQVVLDGTLTGNGGKFSLGKSTTRTLRVSPAFALLRATVQTPEFDETVTVDLQFSTKLDRQQPIPAVKLTPAVENLAVRISRHDGTDNVLRLEGKFEPGRNYRVEVPPTLLAEDGKTLGEQNLSFEIPEIPDRRPSVGFTLDRGILSPHSNLLVEVQTVNVAGLRIGASRVHANNLTSHLHGQSARIPRLSACQP